MLRGLPVVLLSRLISPRPVKMPEFKGFLGRVTKPVNAAELGACLASAIGNDRTLTRSAGNVKPLTKEEREARLRLRLLVVEDNPTNQEVLAGILDHLGY